MTKFILTAILFTSVLLSARSDDDLTLPYSVGEMVKRSDLIVVAAPQETCEMAIGRGPFANGITPTPHYDTFYPKLKVERVLKRDISTKKILNISYTALWYGPKDPPQQLRGMISFKIDPSMKGSVGTQSQEKPLPGSPLKGTRYIFFLEDGTKREPAFSMKQGNETVFFRNFDFSRGMVVATDNGISQVARVIAAQK